MGFFEQYGLLILFTLFLGFMLVNTVIRSRRYAAQLKELLEGLKVGNNVVTVGGIYAKVEEIFETKADAENIVAEKNVLLKSGKDAKTSYFMVNIKAIQGIIDEIRELK